MRIGLGIALASFVALSAACKEEQRALPPVPPPPDAGCRGASRTVDVEDEEAPDVACNGNASNVICAGEWAVLCDGDRIVDSTNCRIDDETCYPHDCDDGECERCFACKPNQVRCGDDGERERCNARGTAYEPDAPCDESEGLFCDALSGECKDLCADAEAERSYIGCEYYAVSTSNSQLAFFGTDENGICEPFSFAIVVANGQSVPARVRIETPEGALIEETVDPSKTKVINLPCSIELTGQVAAPPNGGPPPRTSSVGVLGAHHITSDVPVTIYQFNPLEFEAGEGSRVYSYTNDASLLLPVSALTGNYMATTVPTLANDWDRPDLVTQRLEGPGFITIVGVNEEPTEIEIQSSAHTLASADGVLPALAPGDTTTITLARGEVTQILSASPEDCDSDTSGPYRDGTIHYCKVPRDYDLSGTRITADQPVMVLSGHDCTFVPYDRWACDHVEEVMLPLESWGQDVVVAITLQPECRELQPNVVRVVASKDNTRVTFEPEEVHDPVTLDAGDIVETLITDNVRVIGSKGIAVSQLLVGQEYDGSNTSAFTKGDPSLSLAIPSEQWRKRYSILTPESFSNNFVGVIARQDQIVQLNGRTIARLKALPGSSLAVAQLEIRAGQHTLESDRPFGVTVYGYAPFTSYMVAGGLDLNLINPPQ